MSLSRIVLSLPKIELSKDEKNIFRKIRNEIRSQIQNDKDTPAFHAALRKALSAKDIGIADKKVRAILDLLDKMDAVFIWYKQLNAAWADVTGENLVSSEERIPILGAYFAKQLDNDRRTNAIKDIEEYFDIVDFIYESFPVIPTILGDFESGLQVAQRISGGDVSDIKDNHIEAATHVIEIETTKSQDIKALCDAHLIEIQERIEAAFKKNRRLYSYYYESSRRTNPPTELIESHYRLPSGAFVTVHAYEMQTFVNENPELKRLLEQHKALKAMRDDFDNTQFNNYRKKWGKEDLLFIKNMQSIISSSKKPMGLLEPILYDILAQNTNFSTEEQAEISKLSQEAQPQNYDGFVNLLIDKLKNGKLIALKSEKIPRVLSYIKLLDRLIYFIIYNIQAVWRSALKEIMNESGKKGEPPAIPADDVMPISILLLNQYRHLLPALEPALDTLYSLASNTHPGGGASYALLTLLQALTYNKNNEISINELSDKDPERKLKIERTIEKINQISSDEVIEKGKGVTAKMEELEEITSEEKGILDKGFQTLFSKSASSEEKILYSLLGPRIRETNILNSACTEYKQALASSLREFINKNYVDLFISYYNNPWIKDPLQEIMNDLKNESSPISIAVNEDPALKLHIDKYLAINALQSCLTNRDKDANSAFTAFANEFALHENVLYQSQDKASRTFLKALASTQIIDLINANKLNAGCDNFNEDTADFIKNYLERENPPLYVAYFNAPELDAPPKTKKSAVKDIISDLNTGKNLELTKFAAKHTEFRVNLEKFKSAAALQVKLENKDKNPSKALQKFQTEFPNHVKTLKKSEDNKTKKFFKVIATVFSLGIAYNALWNTKGDTFVEQTSALFSNSKKRKDVAPSNKSSKRLKLR